MRRASPSASRATTPTRPSPARSASSARLRQRQRPRSRPHKAVAAEGKRILLGRIAAAHGIRGEVLIKTFTERPEDIAAYGPLDDGRSGALAVKVIRVTPKGVIARIAGVADRNGAEALKGVSLHVDRR